MKSRFVLFLACLNFFFLLGFSKEQTDDWCIKKCEEWATTKKFINHDEYEVINDQSVTSKRNPDRKTLKILLSNGLQAFLVSDPSLEESAASISVEAGTWDDPDEYEGMAHFVEHLLFLGTEAYPNESDYSQFILERGGQYNAFTKHDRTSYGFSIHTDAFSGALDRLSHFFIDPLLTYSAIQREIHAVHHEFEDSIENDSLRVWRVLKESGNPDHPNVKLSCGNLESLSRVKRKDIVQWINRHYYPGNMRLVLMSPEPLEELAQKAHHFFSRIPKGDPKEREKMNKGGMVSSEQKGNFTYVKPSFKNRSLFLMWEIPELFLNLENSKAIQVLQMAIDHGYANSLSKILERESLAKEVHADFWKITQDHGFFIINVILTDEGIDQYEEVISRCFQALNRVKELGVPEYLLKRLQKVSSASFHNSYDTNFDYVMRLSSELLDEEIGTYPDKTLTATLGALSGVSALLLELNPFDCLYFLVASPDEVGVNLSRIEKWMGSEYFIRKIAESKLSEWNNQPPHPLIGYQPEEEDAGLGPNKKNEPFVESNIEEKESLDPVFVVDNETGRIRWMESSEAGSSIDAFFCIASPLIGTSSKNMALNEIFVHRLRDLLRGEFLGDQDIMWNLEMEGVDLCLFLSVPKEGYLENFRRCFTLLKNASISEIQFNKAKKLKLEAYPGDPSPIDYAHQILDSFLRPFCYTKMELYHALLDLDFEEYESFQSTYFSHIFFEGAFLGGIGEKETLKIWDEIIRILNPEPYNLSKDRSKQFMFPQDAQSYLVMQKTHRKGNALLLLIEAGDSTVELTSIHKILTVVLHSEFFESLRTRQQTAYKLYTWNEVINQKVCHCFGLQSSTHTSLDLLCRVENFLNEFSANLTNVLTPERFEVIRRTLILNERMQKKSADSSEDQAYVDESIKSLKELTYERMVAEIEGVFSEENRRRIAILVEGSHQTPTTGGFYGVPYLPIEKERFHN
jgi:insulysin